MSSLRTLYSLRVVKRIVMTVMGGSVLTIGVALLVLPGPAFIVIPIGLALLATEYAWARRWLRTVKEYSVQLTCKSGEQTSKSLGKWCR
ncbi:MAG TPA: PGPGW domain-containing protein [Candidatus Bathyarchaeia archaeon]